MRTRTFASPGPTRRRSRLGLRLAVLVTGALTLGFLTPLPASAAPGELVARDGAFSEYNDATVRIVLARRVNHGVSVAYRTLSGTAVDGVDFIGKTGRVFFPAGTKVKKVRVAVVDDNADEANEYFRLRIFEPRRATILDRTARVTIVDDDVAQTLSVADTSSQEGGALGFTVRLSQPADQTVSFRYATSALTAGAGDFTATSGFGSIPAGGYQTTIAVPTVEDGLYETSETLRLSVFDVSGVVSGNLDAVGTILDDDTAPQLRINDASVSEGNSTTMTVSLNQVSGAATQVAWRLTDGTAKVNSDYVRDSGTLTIPAGALSGLITVRTYEDSTVEPGEVFYVDLLSPVGASIVDSRGQVTVLDDDGPNLTVSDVTVDEGNTNAVFTVTLSFDPAHNVSFTWSTVNGNAVAPADYEAISENVTITNGTRARLVVPVNTDALDEVNEVFNVRITNVTGANVVDDIGVGTITDDDPLPVLSVPATAKVTEGSTLSLPVTLTPASGKVVTVAFAFSAGAGGATSGTDYTPPSSLTLTFNPGETTKTISVPAANDADTADENFTITLTSKTNADFGNTSTVVTIEALK